MLLLFIWSYLIIFFTENDNFLHVIIFVSFFSLKSFFKNLWLNFEWDKLFLLFFFSLNLWKLLISHVALAFVFLLNFMHEQLFPLNSKPWPRRNLIFIYFVSHPFSNSSDVYWPSTMCHRSCQALEVYEWTNKIGPCHRACIIIVVVVVVILNHN